MGDGYCRHCASEDQAIPVAREFLYTLFVHLKRSALVQCKDVLQEEIQGGCDTCGGERSEQLLELVLKARTARRAKKSPPPFRSS
jgi:hypothetical protein